MKTENSLLRLPEVLESVPYEEFSQTLHMDKMFALTKSIKRKQIDFRYIKYIIPD